MAKRLDPHSQLYHCDHRDYDPNLGRFLTVDPLGFADGPNLYAYEKNNPLIYADPSGLFLEEMADVGNGFGYGVMDAASCGLASHVCGFEPENRYQIRS